ncbi:6011_t:CDS:2, partial [Acaulospora colombiana]
SWAACSLGGTNNSTVFLIGGGARNENNTLDTYTSFVYTFDIKLQKWSDPFISGNVPQRRRDIEAAIDSTGKIYVFGGYADSFIGYNGSTFYNDLIVINSISLTYSLESLVNAPTSRSDYTATMLPSGVIVYIGGYGVSGIVDITQIYLYDTSTSGWSSM